ncbi:hypothetical protein ZIOFF_043615 [Zingiber officinale]|uniref:Uncharacterized protein n=1 Tax=Zingiber officinale TaxID=94328 RepID=A0A8J5FZL4_ZINOF|nr:hypothetical protein ZIOFF_043615 [Zingiber officinale]
MQIQVGQGLSKDDKALKLAFQHWIEAVGAKTRHLLLIQGIDMGITCTSTMKNGVKAKLVNLSSIDEKLTISAIPTINEFQNQLDIGDGKDLDLKECPRSLLKKQCVKYLGPQERKQYKYEPVDGKIVHKLSGELLDTTQGGNKEAKWIFVMSTSRKLYAGQKKKGVFHHSSFLAGGATVAAGRFTAENGILKWALPAERRKLRLFPKLPQRAWGSSGWNSGKLLFQCLNQNSGVFLTKDNYQILSSSNEEYDNDEKQQLEKMIDAFNISKAPQLVLPTEVTKSATEEPTSKLPADDGTAHAEYKRTLSGGLRSPRLDVPKKAILERINSKQKASSYQLGHQLSLKWCSGAGPRIGCVADYPVELKSTPTNQNYTDPMLFPFDDVEAYPCILLLVAQGHKESASDYGSRKARKTPCLMNHLTATAIVKPILENLSSLLIASC